MKFLAFSDVHENKKAIQHLLEVATHSEIEFVVTCGDISTFGRGLDLLFKKFHDLKKEFFVIPGNHEEHSAEFSRLFSRYSWCKNFHKHRFEKGEYVFLGYGGNGFSQEDSEFRAKAREWYGEFNGRKIVFVTHGPAYGTDLDVLGDKHVGNKDYTAFIRRIRPKLVISGHLHETAGTVDEVEEVKFVNPGWDGMVITLP